MAWIEGDYDYQQPRRGEVREATILAIAESDVRRGLSLVVDLGAKRDGIVPAQDLELLDETYRANLRVGDRVPVVITGLGDSEEGIEVSISKGLQQQDWLRAKELFDRQEVVHAPVVELNRGGVLVSFGRLRGFVPNSHLVSVPQGLQGEALRQAKSELMGRTLPLVVTEVDQRRQRLVLSERKAERRQRERLFEELREGDVREGTVTHVTDFGAFVDLGGASGLIHISELDWGHVNRPQEIVGVGDKVQVYVLSVDREKGHVRLSRKRVLPDPWTAITSELEVGQIIEGTVRNLTNFGAFVDLGQGVEGLVHVSEMPQGEQTLSELGTGSRVRVRVLEVDQERRRIGLSMLNTDNDAAVVEGGPSALQDRGRPAGRQGR